MKSTFNILLAFLLFSALPTQIKSQSETTNNKTNTNDTSVFSSDDYIAKTGYNLAPLPEFMIDPFVGLYLGIYSTIFDYGDGKKYPNYYRSLTISAAYGTKGKTNFGLDFLNYGDFLLSAKIAFTNSTLYPFYGYNGYQTKYDANYHDSENQDYITAPFYNYQQKVSRLMVFIQDTIEGTNFNWQIGTDLAYYKTSRVDIEKMNEGEDEEDLVPNVSTLYDHYVNWGIIPEDEKDGGWSNSLQVAMVYDSRDRITNPMNGIWSDFTVRYLPSFLGNFNSAVQLAFSHRQYITLIREKLSFAYRLRYDGCFNDMPFYSRQILADGFEALGGINTLWGIHKNRIIAKQFALGNFELRAKLIRFKFLQQNWYLAAVPLFHTGFMIEEIDMDLSGLTQQERYTYFTNSDKKWYSSYGLGGKIIMNENTVIGLDWAHSINDEAGNDAVYVGFGYSF